MALIPLLLPSKRLKQKIKRSILIFVEDDGPGIPSSEYENVFKPFYKVDKSKTKKLILSEESNEFLICNRFINYDRIDKYKSFNFRAKTNNIFRSRMLILE